MKHFNIICLGDFLQLRGHVSQNALTAFPITAGNKTGDGIKSVQWRHAHTLSLPVCLRTWVNELVEVCLGSVAGAISAVPGCSF